MPDRSAHGTATRARVNRHGRCFASGPRHIRRRQRLAQSPYHFFAKPHVHAVQSGAETRASVDEIPHQRRPCGRLQQRREIGPQAHRAVRAARRGTRCRSRAWRCRPSRRANPEAVFTSAPYHAVQREAIRERMAAVHHERTGKRFGILFAEYTHHPRLLWFWGGGFAVDEHQLRLRAGVASPVAFNARSSAVCKSLSPSFAS